MLVTVSANPSVDQLASCIGLTLMLNKLGKHGTAVFSGAIPSTIEFLKPEDTLEKNTDSLRDFIIALDKSKADKLRYKVEDKVVKIFITPYHTSLSENDLDFSQGDFNIDAVVALGVREQSHLDQAITANGRILHDATVISINNIAETSSLGSINWQDPAVSSLSELTAQLGLELDNTILDAQIATALLTGIVAATDRFSNEKTSSKTMSISAQLVTAGANPQLVATQLEEAPPVEPPKYKPTTAPPSSPSADNTLRTSVAKTDNDGTINIEHSADSEANRQIDIDTQGVLRKADDQPPPGPAASDSTSSTPAASEPPASLVSTLTANSKPEGLEPASDPLSLPAAGTPLLDRDSMPADPDGPFTTSGSTQTSEPATSSAIASTGSLDPATPMLDDARSAVTAAMSGASSTEPLSPIAALNAQPVFENLHASDTSGAALPSAGAPALSHHTTITPPSEQTMTGGSISSEPVDNTLNMPLPANSFGVPDQVSSGNELSGTPAGTTDGFAPPPVPPPMMPTYNAAPPSLPQQ